MKWNANKKVYSTQNHILHIQMLGNWTARYYYYILLPLAIIYTDEEEKTNNCHCKHWTLNAHTYNKWSKDWMLGCAVISFSSYMKWSTLRNALKMFYIKMIQNYRASEAIFIRQHNFWIGKVLNNNRRRLTLVRSLYIYSWSCLNEIKSIFIRQLL